MEKVPRELGVSGDESSTADSEPANDLLPDDHAYASESGSEYSESEGSESSRFTHAETQDDRATAPEARPRKKRNQQRKNQHAQRYQALFEAETTATAADHEDDLDALDPSWLGGSYWTSAEKESFFQALSRSGPDDLPRLARAIQTKTELEIRAYLLLLREQSAEQSVRNRASAPIAFDLGDECDELLDDCAWRAAAQAFAREAARERDLFGDTWLVDDAEAARLDAEADALAGADADADAEYNTSLPLLLRPSSLLQLSEDLFMNEPDASWPDLVAPAQGVHGPTMLRSAFDDLTADAERFTRRLVRAALFQAESRRRAKRERSPKAEVKSGDVAVAAELLGLKTGWKQYWAALPRRRALKVYSQSERYVDGLRKSTKMGVALSPDEAEAELGLGVEDGEDDQDGEPRVASQSGDESPSIVDTDGSMDNDNDERMIDPANGSDARSEASLTLSQADAAFEREYRSDDSDVEMDEHLDEHADEEDGASAASTEDVARSLGPTVADDEEDAIEDQDFHNSQTEERRILAIMFGGSTATPPPLIKEEKKPARLEASMTRAAPDELQWRDSIEYMSEWELPPPPPIAQDFIGDVQRIREEAMGKM